MRFQKPDIWLYSRNEKQEVGFAKIYLGLCNQQKLLGSFSKISLATPGSDEQEPMKKNNKYLHKEGGGAQIRQPKSHDGAIPK